MLFIMSFRKRFPKWVWKLLIHRLNKSSSHTNSKLLAVDFTFSLLNILYTWANTLIEGVRWGGTRSKRMDFLPLFNLLITSSLFSDSQGQSRISDLQLRNKSYQTIYLIRSNKPTSITSSLSKRKTDRKGIMLLTIWNMIKFIKNVRNPLDNTESEVVLDRTLGIWRKTYWEWLTNHPI